MKNLLRLGFLSLLMVGFFTACEVDDGTGTPGGPGGTDEGPSLAIQERDGFVTTSATIRPGEIFNINLIGAKGVADLASVEFDIDGSPFGADAVNRITINSATVGGDNVAVNADESSTIDWEVGITASDIETTQTYMFRLIDMAGLDDRVEVTITTDSNAGGGEVVEPTINFPMDPKIVQPNSLFSFDIDVVAGNPPLSLMGVFEAVGSEAVAIDASRLELEGVPFPDNPFFLEDADKDGFSKSLQIRSQNNESATVFIIAFFDELDNVYQEEFVIDTRPQGNQVITQEGILLNRAGPVNTGGLDFENVMSTGSDSPDAEIIDNGIDASVPATQNWLQTISGTNGVEVRYLRPGENGLPGDFTFASAATDLDIIEAWGSGIDFTLINSDNMPMSNPVNQGDLFVANRDDQYYIFVIKEVNATGNDNNDNYVMDISF